MSLSFFIYGLKSSLIIFLFSADKGKDVTKIYFDGFNFFTLSISLILLFSFFNEFINPLKPVFK